MNATDDPRQDPEGMTPRTSRQMLGDLIRLLEVERRERDRDRAEIELERRDWAQFREWLSGQLRVIHADLQLIRQDQHGTHDRLSQLERRLDSLPCAGGAECPLNGGT